MPPIISSPINEYIVQALDKELNGRRITYNEFLGYLSVLHKQCPPEVKQDFIFSMMDRDAKGHINAADIIRLITILNRELQPNKQELTEIQTQRIQNFVKQIMITFDSSGQSQLRKDDFIKSLEEKEISRLMLLTSLDFTWKEDDE